MITVICPTIAGREAWLERCQAAYAEHTDQPYEFRVYRGFSTCGQAWNAGVLDSVAEFVHLTADDLEPHAGWLDAALAAVDRHVLPCARILNTDGTIQSCGDEAAEAEDGAPSSVARIPFFPHELIPALFPIFDAHYMGDYWIAWKAAEHGWPTQVVRAMCFTHHLATEGRLNTLDADYARYEQETR